MPNIERGEVWLVDLGLAAKARPAVVFSIPFKSSSCGWALSDVPFLTKPLRHEPLTLSPHRHDAHHRDRPGR